jgi:hypothetical protein
MTMMRAKLLAVLFLLIQSTCALAYDLNDVVVPPGAELRWVAEDIKQNGVPMQIQLFSSGKKVNEVLEFYRSQWQERATDEMPGYIENRIPGWSVISILDHKDIVALQLRPSRDGGTEGYLSAVNINSQPAQDKITRNFPRPSGTTLVSSTQSSDLGKKATTIFMINSLSLGAVEDFYRHTMPVRGWARGMDANHGGTSVMLFEKDDFNCELSITEESRGDVIIIANLVKN